MVNYGYELPQEARSKVEEKAGTTNSQFIIYFLHSSGFLLPASLFWLLFFQLPDVFLLDLLNQGAAVLGVGLDLRQDSPRNHEDLIANHLLPGYRPRTGIKCIPHWKMKAKFQRTSRPFSIELTVVILGRGVIVDYELGGL